MPKQRAVIAIEDHQALLASASQAFSSDLSYFTTMVRVATSTERKRSIWAARTFLRAAESEARSRCAAAPEHQCVNEAPCGVGACIYAHPELKALSIRSSGTTPRPCGQAAPYSIEDAVQPLYRLRAGLPA